MPVNNDTSMWLIRRATLLNWKNNSFNKTAIFKWYLSFLSLFENLTAEKSKQQRYSLRMFFITNEISKLTRQITMKNYVWKFSSFQVTKLSWHRMKAQNFRFFDFVNWHIVDLEIVFFHVFISIHKFAFIFHNGIDY